MKFVVMSVSAVVLLAIAAAVFVWSGAYDIAADQPHWRVTERVVDLLRERSIERHAAGLTVPNLDDPQRIQRGAEHYAEMCSACHLTPGMRSTELRTGLYPQPPDLPKHGVDDPAEAFWVIKHGVKLTAMPAWGRSHDDAIIWDMVAFIRQLPKLDEAQFEAMAGSAGDNGHGDAHAHHHDDDAADHHDAHDHEEHDPDADAIKKDEGH